MKKYSLFLLYLLWSSTSIYATNLTISNIEFQLTNDTIIPPKVKLNISWDNAWHTAKNHDGVWLFIKFDTKSGWYRHAKVAKTGHRVIYNPKNIAANFEAADNQAGVFIAPNQNIRGRVDWTIEVLLDRTSIEKVKFWEAQCKIYGIEMVHIPNGGFTLGDPSEEARKHYSFYQSKGAGQAGDLYKLTKEDQTIEVGEASGKLYYQSERTIYHGDQKGPIPVTFPKGVQAFYCMKYELSQGQYAAFLNSISSGQTYHRANFGGKDYYKNRGSIYFDRQTEVYIAESPNRPCNYITWDDAMAYADWAGLRPMTEFEFTKACRGPEPPKANQYPWGTTNKLSLQRGVNLANELVMFNDMTEAELTDQNRAIFGASYYWVMDLAGSLWEKVVTIGDEKGRAFTGKHGDGRITGLGFANVPDWPKGFDEGGYGYRGGGYYYHGRNYHGFNPHSPIAFRPFGAWAGGNRSIAYSTRFVHTSTNKN